MFKKIIFLALLIHPFGTKASNGFPNATSPALYNFRLPSAIISKFYGELQYGIANIYWKAYDGELNSQFFIERSENGKDFEIISAADSISTTDGLNFQYKDTKPLPTGFYRIKAVQADTVYSDILRLSSISGMPDIKVSPDVFDALITVEVNSKINEEFTISLTNSKGKILSSRLVNAEKGINKIVFDDGISFLYADEYTMSVTAVKYSYSQKLYKK
jgi:hypothetical protein